MDWSTSGFYLGIISSILTIVTFVASFISTNGKKQFRPTLLKITGLLFIISLSFWIGYISHSQQPRTIEVSFTSPISDSSNIQITSVEYTPPATILVEGEYDNVPEDKDIYLYVFATDEKYYFRTISKNNGKWESTKKMDIGDKDKSGGTYSVGIALEKPTGDCPSLEDGGGLKIFPECATKIGEVRVKR